MRRVLFASGSVLFLCVALAGAGENADMLTQEIIKQMNNTADVLTAIKDKASADSARPKLRDIAGKMKTLKEKADKFKTTKAQQAELQKKYKTQIEAAQKRLVAEAIRLQTVDGAADALKELEAVK
jgi:hypothetical protein